MEECECLGACPFFNDVMIGMPVSAQLTKDMYCRDDHVHCARYLVFKALGKEKVPPTLFPDDIDTAREIIKAARARDGK